MIVPWGFVLLLHFLFCCFCSQEQSIHKVVVAFEGVCRRKVLILYIKGAPHQEYGCVCASDQSSLSWD